METSRKELVAAYKSRPDSGGVYEIRNRESGKSFIDGVVDLGGSENRFNFSVKTDMPYHFKLQEDWKRFGKESFDFIVLEKLEIKEAQSLQDFKAEIKILKEMWQEKAGDQMY